MRNNRKSWSASGQILLFAILLGVVLVIGMGIVVVLIQTGTVHTTASNQRVKAQSVTVIGIEYATQELSANSTIWNAALNGVFNGTYNSTTITTDCNTGNFVQTPMGGSFKLVCSSGTAANPGLQVYEVAVTAIASGTDAYLSAPLRAKKVYLSQRTLGIDTASGVHAAAALEMVTVPTVASNGSLKVDWGPVVCLDTTTWVLPSPIDAGRYPRKFSQFAMTGTLARSATTYTSGLTTDLKEYWSYLSQNHSPVVDEAAYQALAQRTDISAPAHANFSNHCTVAGHPQCGYIDASGGPVTFDGGFTVPSGAVIYVNGAAEFDNIAIDNATFIIAGPLTVNGSTLGISPAPSLHVPATAPLEYPYYPATPSSWPCQGMQGDTTAGGQPAYDCAWSNVFASGNSVQFRGFLYVKGDMTLPSGVNWNMVGALLVGDPQNLTGSLKINSNAALNLAYDDIINHHILVGPVEGTAIEVVPGTTLDVAAQ